MRKLTSTQKQCHKALKQEIEKTKKAAKEKAHGVAHKYVKIATIQLQTLYSLPRFRDNHNFLLRRYSELEKKDIVWSNVWIPIILTFVPTLYLRIYKTLVATVDVLSDASELVTYMDSTLHALHVVTIIAFVGAVLYFAWSAFYIFRGVISSFDRKPETTIRENEQHIIKELLIDYGIFLS